MDQDIIEVEVVSEERDERKKESKLKKVKTSDRSSQIAFYTKLYRVCNRFGFTLALIFLFGGFAFSILYSQATENNIFFSMMIVFWVFCGLSALVAILGLIFKATANHYMKVDPNYKDYQL